MAVQILRICLIMHCKRRCQAYYGLLIKEIRKDFYNHSPLSILHSQLSIVHSQLI